MILMLQLRDYGRAYTSEISYHEELRDDFRADVRRWLQRLRAERTGQLNMSDAPILVDMLIIR